MVNLTFYSQGKKGFAWDTHLFFIHFNDIKFTPKKYKLFWDKNVYYCLFFFSINNRFNCIYCVLNILVCRCFCYILLHILSLFLLLSILSPITLPPCQLVPFLTITASSLLYVTYSMTLFPFMVHFLLSQFTTSPCFMYFCVIHLVVCYK